MIGWFLTILTTTMPRMIGMLVINVCSSFIFKFFPYLAFYYWLIQQRLVIRKSNGNDCIIGVPFTNVNIGGVSGNVSK